MMCQKKSWPSSIQIAIDLRGHEKIKLTGSILSVRLILRRGAPLIDMPAGERMEINDK
jgi:hypothetical protein